MLLFFSLNNDRQPYINGHNLIIQNIVSSWISILSVFSSICPFFLGPQRDHKHFTTAGQLAHQVYVISPWQSLFVPEPGRWGAYDIWKHHRIPDCIPAFLKPYVVSVLMMSYRNWENSTTFMWQCLNICCSEHTSLKWELFVSIENVFR